MLHLKILILLFISINLFGMTQTEIDTQNKRSIQLSPNSTTTTTTYDNASGNNNINEWTPKDYENNLGKNLDDAVKNAKMLFDMTGNFGKAYNQNPNEMNSSVLSDDPQVQYWDATSQDGLVASSTNSGSVNNNATGTIKCYITRDIPIRYKCEKTGFVVSKQMESDGLVAKKTCEENCYEQMPCVSLVATPTIVTTTINDINFSSQTGLILNTDKVLNSDTLIDYIEFELKVDKKQSTNINDIDIKSKLSISYNDLGENIDLIKDYSFDKTEEKKKISLLQYANKISIKIERASENVEVSLKNINVVFKKNSKYACADLQDMSWVTSNQFGQKCPSGKIQSFNIGSKTIQICADGPIIGDNRDGTYSELSSCQAVCKKSYECKMDMTITDTNLLQDYREGCIQGQAGCNTDTICKNLRLNGTKILNENVFNARQEVKNTIVNSNQVQGIERPRLLLRNDVDFQTKLAEEWKDEAYQYMLTNSTYAVLKKNIGEDTEISNAYSYGINSTTSDGIPIRSLYWILKPKSLDVGTNVYFYNIVEVIAERYSDTSYGTKIKTRDKILYVKTNLANDYYKPFARKINYSQIIDDISTSAETINDLSVWEYQTFNGNNWILLNKNDYAEYMNYEALNLDKPFLRIPIVNDIKNFNTSLPGIIRSKIQVGPYETPFYGGPFLGTGETIGKYTQYVTYSKNRLTYEELFNKIQNNDIRAIYDNLTPRIYPKNVAGDSYATQDINVFLYGTNNKKDGYIRMFPKKDELNRKGFIFIFAY